MTTTTTYNLTGLHCGACVRKVSAALQPFALEVRVSLAPMQAVLTNQQASTRVVSLQNALASIGNYTIEENTANVATKTSSVAIDSVVSSDLVSPTWLATYYPLLLIVGFILSTSVLVQIGSGGGSTGGLAQVTIGETMRYFMAGFFLVFAFFKLLDIRAFANAYAGYDLLAKRWHSWGLVYPFVELALGIAYLTHVNHALTNLATVLVMGVSAIGVVAAVRSKTNIPCACLGTVFKLPMSTVTIVEDLGMVLMALAMLVMA